MISEPNTEPNKDLNGGCVFKDPEKMKKLSIQEIFWVIDTKSWHQPIYLTNV